VTTVSREWVLDIHHPPAGATRRCPVQSSTPLGPDQVNVLSLLRDPWLLKEPYGADPRKFVFIYVEVVTAGVDGTAPRKYLWREENRASELVNCHPFSEGSIALPDPYIYGPRVGRCPITAGCRYFSLIRTAPFHKTQKPAKGNVALADQTVPTFRRKFRFPER
jgi:hypothetical protein